ncbi:MAG: hypothetical protein KatS3mg031_2072 [Chitinophagales bacterium]|nr:MAG: hypothetical protein KatS3mg031_2072 [Chitinophagales bacterium]
MAEGAFRLAGYKPGDLKPRWLNFQPVDSLKEFYPCFVNEEGILVANKNNFDGSGIEVNSAGFRNKEFQLIDTSRKKILLIGDSFTWGLSASPIENCFADILKRGTSFEVINLGIPGADAYQYLALTRKYVPRFRPDAVLVFFFTGNDLVKKERQLTPCKPLYFYTNAGALDTEIDGLYFPTAQDAYNYIVHEKYYLSRRGNLFEQLASKSALLSRLWATKLRIQEKLDYHALLHNLNLTTSVLREIVWFCDSLHTTVYLVAIPEVKEASMRRQAFLKRYVKLFTDPVLMPYWRVPANSRKYFNDYPDAHLNNEGHRAYADYLKTLLDSL